MALGDEFKSSGITENTAKNVLFGAGTIHKGLKFSSSAWNFTESLICATSGGSKISIVPEFTDVEVDGATVIVKGLKVKTGETATMEINPVEITPDIIKMSLIGDSNTSETATGYDEITSRARIKEGDYLENIAFVGKTLEGNPIIAIMDNALCTSGFETEPKNKEAAVPTLTFECHADPASGEFEKLPWHIYYPTPAGRSLQSEPAGTSSAGPASQSSNTASQSSSGSSGSSAASAGT